MELRHLRYFVVLAEELHYARAAARLNIATPTLTVQIQEIERRLGAPLFLRSRRSVALTQSGRIFREEARQVLDRFERAELVGRRAAAGQIGQLSLGYVGTAAYAGVLQNAVRKFRQNQPDIDVMTREYEMEDLAERVHHGEIDVGFVRTPMSLLPDTISRCVLRDRFCLALPADHRLVDQIVNPSPDQLSDEGFVVPEQVAGTNELARRGGFVPRIVARPGRMSAVLTEVSLGTGVAVIPSSVRGVIHLPNLAFRDIEGEPLPSEVSIIFKAQASRMTQMFVEVLDEPPPLGN